MTLREGNTGQPDDGPGAPLPNHNPSNPGGDGGADEVNNVTNNPGIVSPGGMSDASTGSNTNGTPRPVSAQANEATVGAGTGHTPDTVALQHMPTQKSIAVWTEVANGIDKNQTGKSLKFIQAFLSPNIKTFIETCGYDLFKDTLLFLRALCHF